MYACVSVAASLHRRQGHCLACQRSFLWFAAYRHLIFLAVVNLHSSTTVAAGARTDETKVKKSICRLSCVNRKRWKFKIMYRPLRVRTLIVAARKKNFLDKVQHGVLYEAIYPQLLHVEQSNNTGNRGQNRRLTITHTCCVVFDSPDVNNGFHNRDWRSNKFRFPPNRL